MQPYFLPFAGYYQLIVAADSFVLLDDVAFINRGWINRNRILINGEAQYFTIPLSGASQNKLICETEIVAEQKWRGKIEKTVEMAYKKSPFFKEVFPFFSSIIRHPDSNLSGWLYNSLVQVLNYLDIETRLVVSSRYYENGHLKAQDKIIDICLQENAFVYINPGGGKELYNKEDFEEKNISLKFLEAGLKEYKQSGVTEFVPALSMLDLMMNLDKPAIREYLNQYTLH